jgi:hypothetical protein
MRRLVIGLLVIALLAGGAVLGLGAFLGGPIGTQPNVTPQLRIVEPSGPFAADEPVVVEVRYQDFDLRPELRCNPAGPCTGSSPQVVVDGVDQGHVHVYLQRVGGRGPLPNVDSDSFCIPTQVERDGYMGVVRGTCPAVGEKGLYRVSAEFQSNSHVSALKATNRPQDVPTSDDREVRAR